jgi:hypothetical protein
MGVMAVVVNDGTIPPPLTQPKGHTMALTDWTTDDVDEERASS